MKMQMKNTRLITAVISLGIVLAVCGWIAIRRAAAITAFVQPSVIFTVNPGQTARINIIGSREPVWSSSNSRRVMLGFDVYRSNEITPRQPGDTVCAQYHMVERQACEVVLKPGQAASFDFAVPYDGEATQVTPVVSVESNDAVGAVNADELVPTIELREGGRTTSILLLPAVQHVEKLVDRR